MVDITFRAKHMPRMHHQIIFDGKTSWANITNMGSYRRMHPFDMLSQVIMFTERFWAQVTAHSFVFGSVNTIDMELQIVTTWKGFCTMETLMDQLCFLTLKERIMKVLGLMKILGAQITSHFFAFEKRGLFMLLLF